MKDLKGIKKLFELIISESEWILAKAEGQASRQQKEDTRKLGSTTY